MEVNGIYVDENDYIFGKGTIEVKELKDGQYLIVSDDTHFGENTHFIKGTIWNKDWLIEARNEHNFNIEGIEDDE